MTVILTNPLLQDEDARDACCGKKILSLLLLLMGSGFAALFSQISGTRDRGQRLEVEPTITMAGQYARSALPRSFVGSMKAQHFLPPPRALPVDDLSLAMNVFNTLTNTGLQTLVQNPTKKVTLSAGHAHFHTAMDHLHGVLGKNAYSHDAGLEFGHLFDFDHQHLSTIHNAMINHSHNALHHLHSVLDHQHLSTIHNVMTKHSHNALHHLHGVLGKNGLLDAVEHQRQKGTLPAGHPRVREAALLGTNEYSHDDWRHAHAPLTPHKEFAYSCHVEGIIPKDLDGTLFRNGPGKYERGGHQYSHFLDGDGLVVSIDLRPASNKAFARARFVRTEEFLAEEEADTILYRTTFASKPGGIQHNAFDLHTKNVANTNVVFWGGRVHALYEAGVPYELDPGSLATLCASDMEGCLLKIEGLFVSTSFDAIDRVSGLGGWAFTAHPHIDPRTDRLCGWAWQVTANDCHLRFSEWDKQWNRVASRTYDMKDCIAAPHDFGVTESRYVMVQNRIDVNRVPFVLGQKSAGPSLVSQPQLPVLVHVIPREGGPGTVLEGPRESFEIHVSFAHDGSPIGSVADPDTDSHVVTFYTSGWDRLQEGSFLSEWGTEKELSPDFDKVPCTVLWQWVVDTRSGNVTRMLAPGTENVSLDFPRVNPRFEGSKAARYVYAVLANEVGTSGPPRGYVRVDLLKGTRDVWYAPSGRLMVEEPVVVEKAEAQGNAHDTGDVWVVGMAQDVEEGGRSSVLVLDGARLADGPVARIRFNHHITMGLHGTWGPGFHSPIVKEVEGHLPVDLIAGLKAGPHTHTRGLLNSTGFLDSKVESKLHR